MISVLNRNKIQLLIPLTVYQMVKTNNIFLS